MHVQKQIPLAAKVWCAIVTRNKQGFLHYNMQHCSAWAGETPFFPHEWEHIGTLAVQSKPSTAV